MTLKYLIEETSFSFHFGVQAWIRFGLTQDSIKLGLPTSDAGRLTISLLDTSSIPQPWKYVLQRLRKHRGKLTIWPACSFLKGKGHIFKGFLVLNTFQTCYTFLKNTEIQRRIFLRRLTSLIILTDILHKIHS